MEEKLTVVMARSVFRVIPVILAFLLAGCASHFEAWKASEIAGAADSPPKFVMLQANTQGEGIVNTATVKKLIEIKGRIEHAAAYARADFYLSNGNEGPNAYAAVVDGNPVIGINLAMIQLLETDWDAYAGILSHLYAHLKLNHRGTPKDQDIQQSASNTVGTTLKRIGFSVYGLAEQAASTAAITVYAPREELEADRSALRYLRKAGFNVKAALGVWSRLRSVSSQRLVPILDTHPATERRIAMLRKLASQRK